MEPDRTAPGTRVLDRGGAAALVRRRATLSLLTGDTPREVELEGSSLRVGSDPDQCDLAVEDPAVSARHFELSVDEAGWRRKFESRLPR